MLVETKRLASGRASESRSQTLGNLSVTYVTFKLALTCKLPERVHKPVKSDRRHMTFRGEARAEGPETKFKFSDFVISKSVTEISVVLFL